ncbi:hypothetical protein L8W41_07105 [Campylobacter sp. IFREMER_LSEM_CL1904]|uniref:hypothetical protein n=1 Tax=Campylobacter TaxID=194 RepID=UPI00126FB3F0|nr:MULTISPECIES: hypothetical protein [Campylobacter]MBT0825031.1 hypothetical protein [Campylobacter lari]MCV3428494.1 hypothetical protein [Campylobacter sp. IFREMER_LSEM_CL1904]
MFLEHVEKIATYIYESNIVKVIVGAITLYFGISQLWLSRKNTFQTIAKNEIEIFSKLDERQKLLVECRMKFLEMKEESDNDSNLEMLLKEEENLKEYYLNFLDTVCLYAIKENISFKNFYTHYKKMLIAVTIDEDEIKKYENINKAMEKYQKIKLRKNLLKKIGLCVD